MSRATSRSHWKVGVLTCSTLGARQERRDVSGLLVRTWAEKRLAARVVSYQIVPDDLHVIAACLRRWCSQNIDLILTTGGTGFSPTDVTPEATRSVIHRETPGLTEHMRSVGGRKTLMAWLSRGVAGLRNGTLIVNLPGSTRGVRQSLQAIGPILPHALEIVSGRQLEHQTPAKRSRKS